MAKGEAATARLHRALRYPPDSDSDSQPDAIDEQGTDAPAPLSPSPAFKSPVSWPPPVSEQQGIIARLAAQDAARNARFRRLLVALPLLAALPYLPLLVRPPASLLALVVLTSLSATAFLLHRLPPHLTGIAPLDAWACGPATDSSSRAVSRLRLGLPVRALPLETHLPYLNAGLAAMLIPMGRLAGRATGNFGWVGVGSLPAIVYSFVLAAKMLMASVDPERDLSALQYRYKGA